MRKKYLLLSFLIMLSAWMAAACGADTSQALPPATNVPSTENVNTEPETIATPQAAKNSPPTPSPKKQEIDPNSSQKEDAHDTNTDNPFAPSFEEKSWPHGQVYLDASEVTLTKGGEVMLRLIGSLPTPCHKLRALIAEPDAENKIIVNIYSVSDPSGMCVQVLAPFDEDVPLGAFEAGEYTVWVNGEQVGVFQSP
ncbi:MAG: hypothetical protein DRI56_03970 [Chloroflexota bacterium]|nr:MAG: hypothetical protein DRI56_03970 [Chloroflexota bacterium]